jgi:hypothetical protein
MVMDCEPGSKAKPSRRRVLKGAMGDCAGADPKWINGVRPEIAEENEVVQVARDLRSAVAAFNTYQT